MTDKELQMLEAQVGCAGLKYKTATEAARSALDRYMELDANRRTGLKTGNCRFDSVTGGLKKSNLVIIGGETNSGKTTYMLNIVSHIISNGIGVLLFSLEMDSDEVMDVLFAMNGEIDRNHFNNARFTADESEKMMTTMEKLMKSPLFILDDPNMGIEAIRNASLLLTGQYDIGLIVVDYLQLVNVEGFRDNREQQVASISRSMKALAKETKCPIIALSQLNEEGRVRESRGIAHDANIVMILGGKTPDITMSVVKGRSIPKGDYSYRFDAQYARFTETGCGESIARLLPKDEQYHAAPVSSTNGTGHKPLLDPRRGKAGALQD